MNAAAHNGRTYAVSQQKGCGNGSISHAQGAIHHLGEKAGKQHHEKRGHIHKFRNSPDAFRYFMEWNEGEQAMTKQHEEKSEQTPFHDALPFFSARFAELVQFCLLGAEYFGQVVQLSHLFRKVNFEVLPDGMHVLQNAFYFIGDQLIQLLPHPLGDGGRFSIGGDGNFQIPLVNNGS